MSTENTMTGERIEPIVLGRYMLCDVIGGGGMARVHVGRVIGAAGFSRVVAIKRLHPAGANDPDFSTMIIDEARLASRVRHPNVVPTLDVVAVGRELLLVMEYVHGVSIAQLMRLAKAKPCAIPLPIALRIAQDVLAGLHAAHEAKSERGRPLGLVHRDISPQNVIVGTDGVSRIVDFGIAKAEGKLTMTRDGQIKGKLGYMAPEQLRGQELDRRTDIYAVGIVLWELATGRRLFSGRDVNNLVATIQSVTTSLVDPPSKFARVPPGLDAILACALDPDPLDRYESAEAMASALESLGMTASLKELSTFVNDLAKLALEKRSEVVHRAEQTSEIHELPPEVKAELHLPSKALARPPTPGAMSTDQPTPRMADVGPETMTSPPHGGRIGSRGSDSGFAPPQGHSDASIAAAPRPVVAAPLAPTLLSAPLRLPSSPTFVTAPTSSTSNEIPAGVPRRGVGTILAAVAATIIAVGVALLLVRGCAQRSSAVATAKTPSSSLSHLSLPPPPPPPPPPSSEADPEPPPSVLPTTTAHRLTPKAPRSAATATPAPDCNPPYSIDERGLRIPRRECLDR